jgi:signal transduction histidine kinase
VIDANDHKGRNAALFDEPGSALGDPPSYARECARGVEQVLTVVQVQHRQALGEPRPIGHPDRETPRHSERGARDVDAGERVRLSFYHRFSRYTAATINRSLTLSTAQRYSLAILISLAALILRAIMAPLWETTAPFALFMFAAVVTAWLAGAGPALLTGATGLATRLYFDSPSGSGLLPVTWQEAVRLTLFAGFVVATAIILDRMREDRRELEARIADARREIEQRRRVEEALESARLNAEQANKLKDEFLALVSHELRTPLNAILGWLALLRNGALPPERSQHALEIIQKNASEQARLVTDLLDIARSLTGQIQLDAARVDLSTAVRTVVESSRGTATARQIALSLTTDAAPLTVWGDLDRLQQIAGHLLSNAIKFTPVGGEVGVALARRDGRAELVVTNTGAGIEPDFLPHLFEPFRQAETGATRRYGGLGLGLALVRQLVELHGGSVTGGDAGPDGGARFVVRLPLHDAPREDAVPSQLVGS